MEVSRSQLALDHDIPAQGKYAEGSFLNNWLRMMQVEPTLKKKMREENIKKG